MQIESIGSQLPAASIGGVSQNKVTAAPSGGFGDTIKSALSEVNKLQTDADELATKLAVGDPVEIHQAMISMQKASTALQFTIQVRNKVIDAYQEIMRMQV
ncbi:MAG: flagellar hook-basal body complex protein FliE [Armatimonadota bacterium]